MEFLELLAGYLGLYLIFDFILTVIILVFLISVPRHLADIANSLRLISINTEENVLNLEEILDIKD